MAENTKRNSKAQNLTELKFQHTHLFGSNSAAGYSLALISVFKSFSLLLKKTKLQFASYLILKLVGQQNNLTYFLHHLYSVDQHCFLSTAVNRGTLSLK